ncbi:MAG TPA: penicillin-binding protein 1C [Candidatus Binataceae bacterium]|nr:penicillin-binding protein 1C [Candidatus Binataceae bacterium]
MAVLAAAVWIIAGLRPAPPLVNKEGWSQAVFDRDGHLLRLTLASDEKYRLWVPLSEIPPVMVKATLLEEDAWFRWHPGVNPFSLLRAIRTTYFGGSRRLGGSTITMQLARNRFAIDSRSLIGKLQQIFGAIELERFYTKDQILEAYLNLAPYGGNIEGVGAASIAYFHETPQRLSVAQALTLAVIPQSPRLRNPLRRAGREPLDRARERLGALWARKYDAAFAGANAAAAVRAASRSDLPNRAPHLVNRVLAISDAGRIHSTLDPGLESLGELQLRSFVERSRSLGIHNGAVILIDYRTMQVKAYAGSANYFDSRIHGQVNGLLGRRSPGSALKPFIYALAIDQGLIHPRTMLKDTAVRIGGYNPENYDHDFLGPIDATSALVRSRNVPAIEVANMLRPPGLYGFLQKAGIRNLRGESYYGLALALGGAEVSMEELAALYAMLANGGELRPLVFTVDPPVASAPQHRMLSPEASYSVLDMLRENPRPSDDFTSSQVPQALAIPWKTGTSFGLRDAWAMGIVGQYVLGVWIGNFDGTPNANFIGREAAGPLFFQIADALRARGDLHEAITHGHLNLKKLKVCALSGQLPGPYCDHFTDTLFIPGKSPIATCSIHRGVRVDASSGYLVCPGSGDAATTRVYEFWPSDLLKLFRSAGLARKMPPLLDPACRKFAGSGMPPTISSPNRGIIYTTTLDRAAEIPFTAVTDADSRTVYWFIDDELVGTSSSGESLMWKARPGSFLVRAVDQQGRAVAEELTVVERSTLANQNR